MPNNTTKAKGDAKRPRLTLSELASYDDICTDALVDNVFFWSTIRKNRAKYNSGRGFSEDAVTKILFNGIVCDENVKETEAELLRLNGFQKFLARLKTPREQEDFKRHLRKYTSIWLPDSAWEVTTTNRYTVITHEAAVVARRHIKRGETIQYLCGTLVEMTSEEEKDLDLTRRDFSIVTSSRSKRTSLFLGPARFANHDCKANARLTTTGSWGMSVVAVKAIDEGEEITVTYGEDYFGEKNCECLCASCEKEAIGGWTKPENVSDATSVSIMVEQETEPYSLRRRQRYGGDSPASTPDRDLFANLRIPRSRTGTRTPPEASTPRGGRFVKKSFVRTSSTLGRHSSELNESPNAGVPDSSCHKESEDGVLFVPPLLVPTESELRHDIGPSVPSAELSQHIVKREIEEDDIHISLEHAPISGAECSNNCENKSTESHELQPADAQGQTRLHYNSPSLAISVPFRKRDRDSADGTTHFDLPSKRSRVDMAKLFSRLGESSLPILKEHGEPSSSRDSSISDSISERSQIIQADTPISSQADDPFFLKIEEAAEPAKDIPVCELPSKPLDDDSDLSELESDEEFDDLNLQIIRCKKRTPVPKKKLAKQIPVSESPEISRTRYPGDYLMTPILLAEPYSRWVQCKTCRDVWVQPNGYCTRRECPRCERHSKLYGYQWPKVYDEKHERVTDHREVHRFLSATEEEELKGRMKSLA